MRPRSRHAASNALRVTTMLASGILLFGCGGGGGGSAAKSRGATLVAIEFPDPRSVNDEPLDQPPQSAPLIQQIRFRFNDRVTPNDAHENSISIRDEEGLQVPGHYEVHGNQVLFTPFLPLRPFGVVEGRVFDGGGAGLRPVTRYLVRIGPRNWPDFPSSIAPELLKRFPDGGDAEGIVLAFQTTGDETQAWAGLHPRVPRLVEVSPRDGSAGISPQLYGDPDEWFPERAPFQLRFDGPLDPRPENLDRIRLVDLDDPAADGRGLPLGIEVSLRTNRVDEAIVEVQPSGILPFGHLLSLEYPTTWQTLGDLLPAATDYRIAATFSVASDPGGIIHELLDERFDNTDRFDPDPAGGNEHLPAEWNRDGSGILRAARAVEGSGELGPFQPIAPSDPRFPTIIRLNTFSQDFPIPDASTPDAPRVTVTGGVFAFTDIDIPEGVVIEPIGHNPLVLTATGSVRIAGEIRLAGLAGNDEQNTDTALVSLPGGRGGTGGGRGGEGQPLLHRGTISKKSTLSPPRGGRGWGPSNLARIGGEGGQCGILDHPDGQGKYSTDRETSCAETSEHSNGWKPPGGGGGSCLKSGNSAAKDGRGNVLTDGLGNFIIRTPESHGQDYRRLEAGKAGVPPFRDDLRSNNFIGVRGEERTIFGGQGGGAGGSGLDSYFCGLWCRLDNDPSNNFCMAEFGNPPRFGDSVGDSRGGAGGGGGGAVAIRALGPVLFQSTANIDARGGRGGGGEQHACGNYSGAGGGGSGGVIIVQSGTSVTVEEGATLNVQGGKGSGATGTVTPPGRQELCQNKKQSNIGGGGSGSVGILQLQPPAGTVANVHSGANITRAGWVDKGNVHNPSELTADSRAVSRWYDMGRMIERPPRGSAPVFSFRGLDPESGQVLTDSSGNIADPERLDAEIHFLGHADPRKPGGFLPGQEPRPNFIPTNTSITVEFQGANALVPGSKEIDRHTWTEWSATPSIANGMQFLRYRVTFDIALNDVLTETSPRPSVQRLWIRAEF